MADSTQEVNTETLYNMLVSNPRGKYVLIMEQIGIWKRNLEWIEYGGTFQHFRNSNMITFCEKFDKLNKDTDALYMKWSMGRNLKKKEQKFHYIMKFTPRTNGETMLECKVNGTTCYGKYVPRTRTAVINFFLRDKTSVVTYRFIDDKSNFAFLTLHFVVSPHSTSFTAISVCIIDSDEQQMPTIQYGTMCKIDKSLYDKELHADT